MSGFVVGGGRMYDDRSTPVCVMENGRWVAGPLSQEEKERIFQDRLDHEISCNVPEEYRSKPEGVWGGAMERREQIAKVRNMLTDILVERGEDPADWRVVDYTSNVAVLYREKAATLPKNAKIFEHFKMDDVVSEAGEYVKNALDQRGFKNEDVILPKWNMDYFTFGASIHPLMLRNNELAFAARMEGFTLSTMDALEFN
ncbi:MAG: hypothetical protein EOP83_33300 [Verrucomicrobiaceae bacterium]|nr:MAG: hypothetical protein EOP83_33300 [Verrucomicrobiaceae bacterium]